MKTATKTAARKNATRKPLAGRGIKRSPATGGKCPSIKEVTVKTVADFVAGKLATCYVALQGKQYAMVGPFEIELTGDRMKAAAFKSAAEVDDFYNDVTGDTRTHRLLKGAKVASFDLKKLRVIIARKSAEIQPPATSGKPIRMVPERKGQRVISKMFDRSQKEYDGREGITTGQAYKGNGGIILVPVLFKGETKPLAVDCANLLTYV
jgi:hypothetical protein